MSEMAISVGGLGYGGFSAGGAALAFKYTDGTRLLYEANCQGTSGCSVFSAKPMTIVNSIAGEGEYVLFNFAGAYVVKIGIPDTFVGFGPVDFSFAINERDSGKERYKISRNHDVKGVSVGKIEIFTFFRKLDLNDKTNDIIWGNMWAGNGAVGRDPGYPFR
jgi:hypothetical protein